MGDNGKFDPNLVKATLLTIVDSQTISGGPPLTRQLMYMAVDEMVLSCQQPAGGALSEMAVVSESHVNAFVQTHEAFGPS